MVEGSLSYFNDSGRSRRAMVTLSVLSVTICPAGIPRMVTVMTSQTFPRRSTFTIVTSLERGHSLMKESLSSRSLMALIFLHREHRYRDSHTLHLLPHSIHRGRSLLGVSHLGRCNELAFHPRALAKRT